MIKMMLKPFFKRFIGLFISMTFVSMLAVALLSAFGSAMINLDKKYAEYLDTYGLVDEQISTSLTTRENLKSTLTNVEGIEKIDVRLTLDMYIQKENDNKNETLTARLYSYNENENEVFKRYIISRIEPNYDKNEDNSYKYVNVGIIKKFAHNNNIQLGDVLLIGYSDYRIPLYVNEIVETAEAIYPRANEYIWSDNQKFGYIYVSETEFGKGITNIANVALNKIAEKETEEEKELIRASISAFLILFDLPNILDPNIDGSYVSSYGNQMIIRNKPGYSPNEVIENIKNYLTSESIDVKKALTSEQLPYRAYMKNAQKQLTVGSIFLPVFFYSVTMIIIGLFMNQIIKTMTPDIGIMTSIGVGKKSIIAIFLIYAALMGALAGILGCFVGFGINYLLTGIMIKTYSIPILTYAISPGVTIGAIVALIIFAELATFLSCLAIFKITPKDAVISNEAKRKKNPKVVEKIIEKSPMNIKLGLNSIFQNPKRFFVSIFSMFASFVLTMLCCNFYVAKEAMIDQAINHRLNYDCQVYMQEVSDQTMVDSIKNQENVTAFEDCYYTYLSVSANNKTFYVETLAANPTNDSGLIVIPNKKGVGNLQIPEKGIILPKTDANRLKVKIGDMVIIGGKSVEVIDISFQYFHPVAFLSKTTMTELGESPDIAYVSSFLVNVNDQDAFANYFVENQVQCLTVFTNNLSKDLHAIFDTINVMIYIMIGFAFGIGFIILCIMSQNTLMEQKRSVSVLRLIGFTVNDVSKFWSLQSISQMVFALIFAIPAGIGSATLLFLLASSPTQTYPFIFSWPVIAISFGFVLLTVIICHSLAMLSVKRWNLADNTRSRE